MNEPVRDSGSMPARSLSQNPKGTSVGVVGANRMQHRGTPQ